MLQRALSWKTVDFEEIIVIVLFEMQIREQAAVQSL